MTHPGTRRAVGLVSLQGGIVEPSVGYLSRQSRHEGIDGRKDRRTSNSGDADEECEGRAGGDIRPTGDGQPHGVVVNLIGIARRSL